MFDDLESAKPRYSGKVLENLTKVLDDISEVEMLGDSNPRF